MRISALVGMAHAFGLVFHVQWKCESRVRGPSQKKSCTLLAEIPEIHYEIQKSTMKSRNSEIQKSTLKFGNPLWNLEIQFKI